MDLQSPIGEILYFKFANLILGCHSQQIDIRLLPSLVPEDQRNVTAKLVAPELEARIDKLREIIDAGLIDAKSNSNGGKKLKNVSACLGILTVFAIQKSHL